jgi:F0F1-type ATP synthase membrane subunit c/vacuolar-type H+-ATPase subunit K
MAEGVGEGQGVKLVRASQVAREAEVRRSANGVRFATYGETGVPGPDLDRMLEAVPAVMAKALKANTYFFVPVALREPDAANVAESPRRRGVDGPEQAMVAPAWDEALSEAAICHRNVGLDSVLGSGHQGVFISTRLMGDRFALSFEFFINVAHAFVDEAGVPERFAELVWQQALSSVRGETSLDAWEARNVALGRPADWQPEAPVTAGSSRRARAFGAGFGTGLGRGFGSNGGGSAAGTVQLSAAAAPAAVDEKERGVFVETAFSDAVAIYLLSLALDFDYSELRERDYPLLAPGALAERLRLVAELFPPNPGYEFAVRYRRRA